MTNILQQTSSWYNPFFLDDREVKNIYFYNESGILCDTGRGWFGGNNGLGTLIIGETIRKGKFNPAAKCNFWIPVAGPDYKSGKFCDVYLYVDGADIICERLPDTQTDGICKTSIEHWQNFAVSVHGFKSHIEKYLGSEKTKFGRDVDKLAETFKEMGIQIDHYNTIKLLESFSVRRKK